MVNIFFQRMLGAECKNFVYKAGFLHLSFQIAEKQHGHQNVKYAYNSGLKNGRKVIFGSRCRFSGPTDSIDTLPKRLNEYLKFK